MHNIEIHGMFSVNSVLDKIWAAAKSLGLENETAVTYCRDEVFTDNKQAPSTKAYLRIYSNNSAQLIQIIDALRQQNLGLDCEIVNLQDSFPSQEMTKDY